jgi:glycosyltransferase involved in cell wall biosynthesis
LTDASRSVSEDADSGDSVDVSGDIPVEVDGDEEVLTSVVLPAYNENGNIRPLVDEIVAVFEREEAAPYRPYEIVIVDDGSHDGTRDIVMGCATEYPQVRAVLLTRNFGQSAAISAGVEQSRGRWLVTMDADRQNNPEDVVRLLDTLRDGYDCVSGWRAERNDPPSKTIPSAIQTYLTRLTGLDIHDFGCTLKAYRANAIHDIDIYGEGHRYIPAKLHDLGYRITEVPVDHRPRVEGETKYGATRLLRGFIDLLFHVFWHRYSTRPAHFLGGLGVVFMSIGVAIGSHAIVIKYVYDVALLPKTPRLILTVALLLFGLQLLMFGFLAEMITKLYYDRARGYRVETVIGSDESPRVD